MLVFDGPLCWSHPWKKTRSVRRVFNNQWVWMMLLYQNEWMEPEHHQEMKGTWSSWPPPDFSVSKDVAIVRGVGVAPLGLKCFFFQCHPRWVDHAKVYAYNSYIIWRWGVPPWNERDETNQRLAVPSICEVLNCWIFGEVKTAFT